ncbi:MAG: ABC transporter substrate-binding protein [Dehalococcoidia bacterium]|nr:MAG: ABC transporter substrate-binding protein [Dehalococcoidia bacterium]
MRKLAKFSLIFLSLAALLLVLAVACEDEEEEEVTPTGSPAATVTESPTPTGVSTGITDEKIILGSHFAQSGTYGAAFAPVLAGLEAYFRYVNAEEGGVCGREIDFRAEDDQYDPARAVEAVRKLVEEDEVFAIVAGLGTAAHSAVWEDLNEKGIPDLWIMTGAHKWAADVEAHPWSVAILPDYFVAGSITGKYISENLPGKNVGVLYQNDDFGQDHVDGLKHGLDPTKNEVVSEQSYESTAVDIRSQVNNLKNAGAEVVLGACIPGHCAQLVKTKQQLDWDVQVFMSYVNSDAAMFAYAPPTAMEGVITLQANKMYDWTDDPAVAEHHRIMSEYGDLPPGNYTIVGQVAGELTIDALSRTCDNLTRQGLLDAVHDFENYQSELSLPGVTLDLSPTDHLGFEAMRMLQATLVDGKGKWEYFGDVISFEQEE